MGKPDKAPVLDLDEILTERTPQLIPPSKHYTRKIPRGWIKGFIDFASYGEAPTKMLFWTGVATVAGALRRRVWIDQKYFTWTPNFYIILVAKPGIVSKSTTINIGMNLLREVQGIKFGPDVITWQALLQTMDRSSEEYIDPQGNKQVMSAVTVGSDEFGTFLNPQDREMMDVMVSLWDGKRGVFNKITKTSGQDVIENPWINVIACTTPSWISQNFPDYMIGGGFTSRCIFVYADAKRQYVPYPGLVVPADFDQQRQDLIDDLAHISNFYGEFQLSPAAVRWGTNWYSQHWSQRPSHLDGAEFEGYVARKQTHIHKLGMVLSASYRDSLIIEEDDLVEAESFLLGMEHEMQKVFSGIGLSNITRLSKIIFDLTRAGPKPISWLYQQVFRLASYEEFTKALTSAEQAGYVQLLADKSGQRFAGPK